MNWALYKVAMYLTSLKIQPMQVTLFVIAIVEYDKELKI